MFESSSYVSTEPRSSRDINAFALLVRLSVSFFPFSITHECKELELLDLLQCIAVCLQRTLTLVPGELQYLSIFSAGFHSRLIARSWKPIRSALKAPLRRYKQQQIVCKEQTVDPAAPNSDTPYRLGCDCLYDSYILCYEKNGVNVRPCRRSSPTVNGCDSTLLARAQISEQAYNGLLASGRW